MLKYKLHKEDEKNITYLYFPEGHEEFGSVTLSKISGEISEHIQAKTDEFKRYLFHMIDELEEFFDKGEFRKEGIVAWY